MLHDDSPKPLRELDETAASAAEDRFEEILAKVIKAGADVTMDQEAPLYADIAGQDAELGRRRVVEFNLNKTDFQIIRDEKNKRVIGVGHRAALQDLSVPSITIKLKRKPEISDQWTLVDIEDMF
jgi:hypothetical protein